VKGLLILGGGGHAKVVIDVARAAGFAPAGILDPAPSSDEVLGVPVIGDDGRAEELFAAGHRQAFVALGDNRTRRRIGLRLLEIGFDLPPLVHPAAIVSPSAGLGAGVCVMPLAAINAGARIGDLAIVNTGAIVEHDCVLGGASHVAPGSTLGGGCFIGAEVLFGVGAAARPGTRIADGTVVGAGSAVACDIGPRMVVGGAPARPLTR
jgi:UDP-perosamine 4-acetyltransferase